MIASSSCHAGLLTLDGPEPVLHAHEPEHERVVRGVGQLGVVLVEPGPAEDLDAARVVLPHRRRERALQQECSEPRILRQPIEEIERGELEMLVPRQVGWKRLGVGRHRVGDELEQLVLARHVVVAPPSV